ncbi:MAG TPA: polymer-forming cytoskeletal protein [Anaerolineae bacterium]|nr:polymer-forming cytoskeletal protein [Anaerolineae bacterium]
MLWKRDSKTRSRSLAKKERTFVAFEGKIENILGPTASFQGHLKAAGNVRIDGHLDGSVETTGNVIIGEAGKVTADIIADNIQVWGALKGNITASGRLEILPSGRVWGEIKVASLLIDEGGLFRGKSVMAGDEAEPSPFDDLQDPAA